MRKVTANAPQDLETPALIDKIDGNHPGTALPPQHP